MCKLCDEIGKAIIIKNSILTEQQTDQYHQCEYVEILSLDDGKYLMINQNDGDGERQDTCMKINYCPECGKSLVEPKQ